MVVEGIGHCDLGSAVRQNEREGYGIGICQADKLQSHFEPSLVFKKRGSRGRPFVCLRGIEEEGGDEGGNAGLFLLYSAKIAA